MRNGVVVFEEEKNKKIRKIKKRKNIECDMDIENGVVRKKIRKEEKLK